MVRNVFLIFIHDKLSINEVRIKVTQATGDGYCYTFVTDHFCEKARE